ncbi:hypothetical protein ElyMa_006120000 [Elysia marginata]|uniref:Uncharacterized protein n=1 Tax=Elysia marginata TaxID=1093978 RepID=A0AAV4GXL7_9GAST|nr:hypothetical protein ElyMa_006120000 [Elysia marginata]
MQSKKQTENKTFSGRNHLNVKAWSGDSSETSGKQKLSDRLSMTASSWRTLMSMSFSFPTLDCKTSNRSTFYILETNSISYRLKTHGIQYLFPVVIDEPIKCKPVSCDAWPVSKTPDRLRSGDLKNNSVPVILYIETTDRRSGADAESVRSRCGILRTG